MGPVAPTTWSAKGEGRATRSVASRTMTPSRASRSSASAGYSSAGTVPTGTNQSGCTPGRSISSRAAAGSMPASSSRASQQGIEVLDLPGDHPDLLHRLLGGDGAPVDGQEGAAGRPGPGHPQGVVFLQ